MHRAAGVTDQDDILVCPVLAANDIGVEPNRAIGKQRVAAELRPEDRFTESPALIVPCSVEPGARPGFRIDLDEEGAEFRAVLVAMRDENAKLGFAEDQRYRVEKLVRPIPGEFVTAGLKARPKRLGV